MILTCNRDTQVYLCLVLQIARGVFLALALSIARISGQCQPGQTPQEAGLEFPDIFSQSFKAEMAGVSLHENAAIEVQEHYSVETGKGSVHNEGPGDDYHFYLVENETIREVGDRKNCMKLGSTPSTDSRLIQITRKAFNPENVTFVEKTQIAGIPVNHWRVCYPFALSDDDTKNLIGSLDTYIVSDETWEMFTGTKNTLLRLSLDVFEDDMLQEDFYLDFLNFETLQYDSNVFQADLEPPLGVVCGKPKENLTQPIVPSSASFRRETVSRHGDQSYISDVENIIIDTGKQVIQKQNSVATNIRDFNHGATYLILRVKGDSTSCRIFPVNKLQTLFHENDTISGFTSKDHYISMDSVSNYLYLSGDFSFNGEYEYRGIPCEVFTHVTDNYGGLRQRAVIFLYFSKPGFLVADHNGFSESKLVKIKFQVGDADPVVYNIYLMDEFHFDEALTAPFDISPCFDEDHRIEFNLKLEEQGRIKQTTMTANERCALEHEIRTIIAELCGLDLLRVHIGMAVEREGTVSLTGKLFARPDSGVHFENSPFKSFGMDSRAVGRTVSVFGDVENIEKCADKAVLDTSISDADYCHSVELCILYRAANSPQEGLVLVTDEACSHLTKIRGFEDLVPLSTAWSNLETEVSKEELIELAVGDKILVFSSIMRTNDPNSQQHNVSPLNSFKKAAHSDVKTSETHKISGKLLLKECAEMCLNNLVFPCQAFSYCVDSSSCELHGAFELDAAEDKPRSERAPGFIETRNCQTYVRSYMHNFERYPGKISKTISSSSDVEITDIKGIENCAKLCMERRDFQCESFDFCSQNSLKGNCLLSKQHWRIQSLTHEDEGQPELNCFHYSRNYFWDYTMTEGVTSLPIRANVISAGGAEECAFQCSLSPDCDTFHYCKDADICQYIDTSGGKPSPGDILPRNHCYTFIQKDTSDVINRHDNVADKLMPVTEGYSAEAMAGLAVAMFVLGVALCLGGLYAWTFYKRRVRVDGWNTSLSESASDDQL